jgi:hypothetical protein
VRAAVPSAEAYYADTGSYSGMTTLAKLQAYDQGVDVDTLAVSTDFKTFCLAKSVGGKHAYVVRGAAAVDGGKVQQDAAAAGCPALP